MTASILTAFPVTWSNGSPFTGSLLLLANLPDTYKKLFYNGIQIPTRFCLPIKNGTISTADLVLQTNVLQPENVKYYPFWYDTEPKLIATGPGFSVTSSSYTITPPTLNAPAENPAIPSAPQGGLPLSQTSIIRGSWTPNGTDVSFTLPGDGIVMILLNGVLQTQGLQYVKNNFVVTFINPPQSGDQLEYLIFA